MNKSDFIWYGVNDQTLIRKQRDFIGEFRGKKIANRKISNIKSKVGNKPERNVRSK